MASSNVRIRRPKFSLTFVTENSKFHVVYDADDVDNNYMTESVLSMSTKNAFDDDTSAFSFVLSGDVEWTKLLNENDLVILHIDPHEVVGGEYKKPFNDTLIVGLISEVRLEGEYRDNSKLYRITGQSFQKAFVQFMLQTIQQAGMSMSHVGWMDYAGGQGSEENSEGFTSGLMGRSISDVILIMLDRFTQYMRYNFEDKEAIDNRLMRERLVYSISSWNTNTGWEADEEQLVNPLPFTSYEGSFNQLLKDIASPPFCEMFFDTLEEDGVEKSEFVVRRTPFNRSDWRNLPRYEIHTSDILSESIARNDLEAYSIFNVVPETEASSQDSGLSQAVPYFNKELVYKYGYSLLEVSNKFLTLDAGTTNSGTQEDGDSQDINDADESADTIGEADRIKESTLLASYSRRLYNWYANNVNFFSGDITVLGHPDYRLGNRLLVVNKDRTAYWEYYIESVEHTYSYENGYITTLGVTRGVQLRSRNSDGIRFKPPMGGPELFKGGFMGEMSLKDIERLQAEERAKMASLAASARGGVDGSSDGGGGTVYSDANVQRLFDVAEQYLGKPYVFGGASPRTSFDCSGFIYWVYKEAGWTNWSRMNAASQYRRTKRLSKSEARPGDLVFFSNTYKRGISHVGIYAGNNRMLHSSGSKGVAYDTITGYWSTKKPEYGRL